MGSMCEILRVFDLHTVFPEINSLQTAVRRVAHEYLSQAEDYGYSPDICGYVKADVAVQLRNGEHPMGRIPKPSIAVLTNACNTYIKWAEIWERFYHIPVFTLDIPASRGAEVVCTSVLLARAGFRAPGAHADLVGFEVGPDFVVGYGLDMAGKYRNLPYLAAVAGKRANV
jgi:hypothetical protein